MAKLNRSHTLRNVNQSLIECGSAIRVRYNPHVQEYKVIDLAFLPGDARVYFTTSMVDAIETAKNMALEGR